MYADLPGQGYYITGARQRQASGNLVKARTLSKEHLAALGLQVEAAAAQQRERLELYRLELELANPDGDLLPGMFLRAQVVKTVVPDAFSIPIYSVITRNNEQFVFVVRDGVVHKQPVVLGIMEKWMIQAAEGLKAGDMLVIEGHREVEEGQPVNVLQVITDPTRLVL